MGRQKKFDKRKNVSVTFESREHDDLRLVAFEHRMSVSAYIRKLVIKMLRSSPSPGDPDSDTTDET